MPAEREDHLYPSVNGYCTPMANVPTPISDAQARAMEASANAAREAIQALRGLGGYLERVFGTVPEDLVGYFGGDRLKVARAENIVRIMNRSKEISEARKVEPTPISISLALPLLVAAADESRDELVDLWARLLAAAADPNRTKRFRARFIETAKQMDPLDASVLAKVASGMQNTDTIINYLSLTRDEMSVSTQHLRTLELLAHEVLASQVSLAAYGREFLRAVND